MDIILSLYEALTTLDYVILSNPSTLWLLYVMLFVILFLENGLLPTAFLPGDSLLFITGILISVDLFHFGLTNIILVTGGALGTWFGYAQGRWLGSSKLIQSWLNHLPQKYHQRAQLLFHKYGLAALFIGRFIPFIRTMLPVLAGFSGLKSGRFHIYNWISATLWIFIITSAGYIFGSSAVFKAYEKQFMILFMFIPVFLLFIGLVLSLWFVLRRCCLKKDIGSSTRREKSIDNKRSE